MLHILKQEKELNTIKKGNKATCQNMPPAVQLTKWFEESQGGFFPKCFQIMTKMTVLIIGGFVRKGMHIKTQFYAYQYSKA